MTFESTVLNHEMIMKSVVETVKKHNGWFRVVSIDLETKVLNKNDFLTGERILGIGIARRSDNGIETKVFKLKEESDSAEVELLNQAANWLSVVKPLILIGYNISGYDFPLLSQKINWYNKRLSAEGIKPFPREYWALRDAVTTPYILDIMHPLKYLIAQHEKATPKHKKLEEVINHELFRNLKLMRKKSLVKSDINEDKGKVIYDLWRNGKSEFDEYLTGDVHDVLLLAEYFFGL